MKNQLDQAIIFLLLLTAGCAYMLEKPAGGAGGAQPQQEEEDTHQKKAEAEVAPVIVRLLDDRKLTRLSIDDFRETALKDIIRFTTPAGYRLKNRYLELGVSLAQNLALSDDEQLQGRLVEAARWAGRDLARSEAIVALALQKNPDHLKYFREALLDNSLNIQFAAIEALQIWGHPQAAPMLLQMSSGTWSPLIRVYSAQAALRMGEPAGREKLLKFLKEANTLVRAMAARYLGELGKPEDADVLLTRIGPEQQETFVLAEVAIAALNLSARKQGARPPPPGPPPPPRGIPRRRQAFELEPLVVTAPRTRMKTEFVDVRIDSSLTALLEKLAEAPPDEQIVAAEFEELVPLVTPVGFSLKVRYSDLTFLLIEGLAGSRNMGLVQKLESIAKDNPSSRARAAALVALAYDKTRHDIAIFQQALRDTEVVVRFAAVEALGTLASSFGQATLADVANNDASPALRVYAAQALRRAGDPYGRQVLLRQMDDNDWIVRGMAIYYLGELGEKDDYYRIASKLNTEQNDFVASEICGAMLKLASIQ